MSLFGTSGGAFAHSTSSRTCSTCSKSTARSTKQAHSTSKKHRITNTRKTRRAKSIHPRMQTSPSSNQKTRQTRIYNNSQDFSNRNGAHRSTRIHNLLRKRNLVLKTRAQRMTHLTFSL